MCLPVFAPLGAAMMGGTATAATAGAAALGTMTVMSVATTALSIKGQRDNAKAQAIMQDRATKAEYARAAEEGSALRLNQQIQQENRAVEQQAAAIKAEKARARARTAAGESGVSGQSVDDLINSYTQQEAAFRLGLKRQAVNQDLAANAQLRSAGLQSANNLIRINQPIQQPDYAGTIMSGINQGLSNYLALKPTS